MTKSLLIEHLKVPRELALMWKDAEHRRHFVGTFSPEEFKYTIGEEERRECKFPGYPAFPFGRETHRNPLSSFFGRCPAPYRGDFKTYLKLYTLNPEEPAVQEMIEGLYEKKTDAIMMLLGYTGALVPFDPFNIVNTFKEDEPPFEFLLQAAGYHYRSKDAVCEAELVGQDVTLEPEPENPFDPDAIALYAAINGNRIKIGYIPNGYQPSFAKWKRKNWSQKLTIYRFNGPPKHRFAYIFVKIS